MTTRLPRRLAALITAIAVTAAALVVGLGVAPAEAKPPVKPGPVTGLAMTLEKPADNFTVSASWNAATNATTYAVSLTNAQTGTALAGGNVGVTSWSASVNLAGVTQVRLTVTPMNQRSGTAASVTQDVPDLSAPFGTFTVSLGRPDRHHHADLADRRRADRAGHPHRRLGRRHRRRGMADRRHDRHLYAAEGLYRPTVTLSRRRGQQAGVVQLAAIVPGDKTAPVGTFTTSPATAWEVADAGQRDPDAPERRLQRRRRRRCAGSTGATAAGPRPGPARVSATPRVRGGGHLHPVGRPQGRGRQHPLRSPPSR